MFAASTAWPTAFAGLGGAVIAAGAVIWATQIQRRDTRRGSQEESRTAIYVQLWSSSAIFAHEAELLRHLKELRAGPLDGLRVLLRLQRPLDLLDLDARLRPFYTGMYEAWARLWVSGSQEAIRAGNHVIMTAADVMAAMSTKSHGQFRQALAALATARKDYSEVTRRELDQPAVELFTES